MNNYDQSSSGINLELQCFYDNDLSRFWFEESLTNIYRSGGSLLNDRFSDVDLWLYHNGAIDDSFDLTDLDNYTFSKNDLYRLLIVWSLPDAEDLSLTQYDKSLYKLTKSELAELIDNNLYEHDKMEYYNEYLNLKAFVVSSHGYCQGDYAEIVIPFSLLDNLGVKYKAKDFDIDSWIGDTIDHLFWDSPLHIRLDINDQEYEIYIDECLKDQYNYDQDEIKTILKDQLNLIDELTQEQKEYIFNWTCENLPTQPDCR